MAKQLNAEQKTISQILNDPNKPKFLIPDYQRPYSWEREQCETLWDDILSFAFPLDHAFNAGNDRYFLGTILTFQNASYEHEVIDGQQRLITFLLMLRAFYAAFEVTNCKNRENILASIGKCIWNGDEFGNVDKTSLKLKSEVASDDDIAEFKKILETGETTKEDLSNYAKNYRDFQEWIKNFKAANENFSVLPMRILNNCILLPIEADNQNTALRIFTTLNDRGMPLSDADIFKAQFYKFFSRDGKQAKELFIKRWKELEALCNKNFHPRKGTSVDDLFRRYMYYAKTRRAVERNERISDTFSDQRDFYAENNYELLHDKDVYEDLETLAQFWDDVANRNEERFSLQVLKRLYVLSYSPYSLWSYVVSLYFMSWRELDEEDFCQFLDKMTALILMNALLDSGKQNIRRLFVLEFKNIYNGDSVKFEQYRQKESLVRSRLGEMKFSNTKPITRTMLAWWTFQNPAQELPPLDTKLQLEHIYAKSRHADFKQLKNPDALELLGNKALLEEKINKKVSNNPFADKKILYRGDDNKAGTFNLELRALAETYDDFTEDDIIARNEKIFDAFIKYLREQNLLV